MTGRWQTAAIGAGSGRTGGWIRPRSGASEPVAANLEPVTSTLTGGSPDAGQGLRRGPLRSPTLPATDEAPGIWPYVGLITVLLLWGFGPPISKLISASPLTVSVSRLYTSAAAMVAVQLVQGSRPTRKAMRHGAVGGIAFGCNSIVFFYAIANASVATITIISALQPVLVMFGAWRLFGERITRWGLGWTGVAVGGAAWAVLGAGAKVHSTLAGVLFSVGSLVCMSVYFLGSKSARKHLGAGDYVMSVMLWASIVVTPVAAIGGGFGHFDQMNRMDWLWVVVMLIGPGLGGQYLMGWAVRYVPVSLSAMILLGSTVVSIVAAWPIHHEQPAPMQLVGAAVTLGAVFAILRRR